MPSNLTDQPLVNDKRHEMLMRSFRLHPIRGETEGKGRLKAETRIIRAVPNQKNHAIAGVSHRFYSRLHQGRANTAALIIRSYRDWPKGGKTPLICALADGDQAVGGVSDDLPLQQRH